MTDQLELARTLMLKFAAATGVIGPSSPTRYLWTDAHAVCNFLTLWRASGDEEYIRLAASLIRQVHHHLGQYRADDSRVGWLSGMSELEAERHPTAGGLRIGKPMPERGQQEAYDEQAEWNRDGQYFHYLTKWAHALGVMAVASNEAQYQRWAMELMSVAYDRFRINGESTRLVWKMRVDLSAPLVAGSSPHDALDGAVTCLALTATSRVELSPAFSNALRGLLAMCGDQGWDTADPLGLGGLLFDACRLAQLPEKKFPDPKNLLEPMLVAVTAGISQFSQSQVTSKLPSQRLAFRELGLVIGMQSLDLLYQSCSGRPNCVILLDRLYEYRQFSDQLLDFWVQDAHRHTASWIAHQDINDVMLATSLAPTAFLTLPLQ